MGIRRNQDDCTNRGRPPLLHCGKDALLGGCCGSSTGLSLQEAGSVVGCGANDVAALSLHFLICKMGTMALVVFLGDNG